jgi:hypothetical protein
MCDHEVLVWLDFVERGFLDEFGRWPTIREVLMNLREYHGVGSVGQFAERVRYLMEAAERPSTTGAAREEPWLELVPCGSDCHAWHLRMNAAGRRQLDEWNRKGCQSHWRHTKFRKRKRPRECADFVPPDRSVRQENPAQINFR